MWIRLRFDIGWRELICGLIASLRRTDRFVTQQNLESHWSRGGNDALACLSVRSGFDLLFQSLELPAGSEVLFSAITITAMPEIAKCHGLVPVPVDVCGSDFHIDIASLEKSLTSKSKILVVAHLFGSRPDMSEVLAFARDHNLFVVEDCAQAWYAKDWRGDEQADISLFSFGAIKTVTAFGGALCRVKNSELLARMRKIQMQQPIQSTGSFLFRYLKFALLKGLSTNLLFGCVASLSRISGCRLDALLGNMTRGFCSGSLLNQLRKQPSAGLLRMLEYRLQTYDEERIQRRIRNAKRIIANLGLQQLQPELLDGRNSFWLFPLITDQAEALIPYLRQRGFDAAQRGRMEIVTGPADRPELACPMASELLRQTVFLPCYPEMTDGAIDEMCASIKRFFGEIDNLAKVRAATLVDLD